MSFLKSIYMSLCLPPRLRSGFIIGFMIVILLAFAFVSAGAIVENGRLRQALLQQQRLVEKTMAEKKVMEKDFARLKSEAGELVDQKALYTATIETLMKKEPSSR